MVRRFAALLFAALLASVVARPARGAVFLRRPRSCSAAMEALGGVRLEESAVEVNGATGVLRVYAFERAAAALAADADRELRAAGGDAPGDGSFCIDWARRTGRNNAADTLLVVPCGAERSAQCLAFVLEADAPGTPRWPWSDLTPPADAQPAFAARIGRGRAGFVSGVCGLSPAAAGAAWRDVLDAAGWTTASPAPEVTSLILCVREDETLALLVLPPEGGTSNGGSRFAVLRRRTGMP